MSARHPIGVNYNIGFGGLIFLAVLWIFIAYAIAVIAIAIIVLWVVGYSIKQAILAWKRRKAGQITE